MTDVPQALGVIADAPRPNEKVGLARVARGAKELFGVRIPRHGDVCGWYLWSGDRSDDPDFFEPVCVADLDKVCPEVQPLLSLPAGWSFELTPEYLDVCFMSSLCEDATTTEERVERIGVGLDAPPDFVHEGALVATESLCGAHTATGWYVWTGSPSESEFFRVGRGESESARVFPSLHALVRLPVGWRFSLWNEQFEAWFEGQDTKVGTRRSVHEGSV